MLSNTLVCLCVSTRTVVISLFSQSIVLQLTMKFVCSLLPSFFCVLPLLYSFGDEWEFSYDQPLLYYTLTYYYPYYRGRTTQANFTLNSLKVNEYKCETFSLFWDGFCRYNKYFFWKEFAAQPVGCLLLLVLSCRVVLIYLLWNYKQKDKSILVKILSSVCVSL